MTDQSKALINPYWLRWARLRACCTLEEAVYGMKKQHHITIDEAVIARWESTPLHDDLTVELVRDLLSVYHYYNLMAMYLPRPKLSKRIKIRCRLMTRAITIK